MAVETVEKMRVGRKKPKVDNKTRKVDNKTRKVDSKIEKVGNKTRALPKNVTEMDEIHLFSSCSKVLTPKNRLHHIPFQPFQQISPPPFPSKTDKKPPGSTIRAAFLPYYLLISFHSSARIPYTT
ncbi:hypothetical protein ABER02_04765 [Rossellomorea marisflavi]|uniref:hypothetical protein n=1 Tax=Rossellomorea marisflavi TaxID=189381 RepID=UPI003D282077